ncbi:Inositol-pentakisphosphate 2-kinase IPK1 at N-terminal half [Coccomyxa sp. Obi]|nr:Inositol-pentakisphosphate 2-kinase IPK1 at N-terminal half [Coccomyxa sp. Obi]
MTDLDNPHSWKLKGQGNANVVFAYTGNCQWLVGTVLRIRKTAQNVGTEADILRPTETLESCIWSPLIPQSISGAAERQTAYEEAVLRQLLDAQYIHTGFPCQLSTEFAAALAAQLQSADRSLSCRAWLLPDHTVFRQCADNKRLHTESSARGLEGRAAGAVRHAERNDEAAGVSTGIHHAGTLCVEIKPKCGFIPTSTLIRPEHEVKKRVPRFQLHQRLKLAQGKIKQLSNYNPLDLFSGEPQKVEAALAAMFEEPQNNLQLFLDGSPMQLPQDDRLPSLQRLPEVQQAGGLQGLIRLLRIILLREGVLDRILKVQKMDVHDIEGIHPLLAALLQRHTPANLPEDTPQCRQGATCASTERAAPTRGKPGPTNIHGYVDRAEAAAAADRCDKHSGHHPTKRSEEGVFISLNSSDVRAEMCTSEDMSSQPKGFPAGSVSSNIGAQPMGSQRRGAIPIVEMEDGKPGAGTSDGTHMEAHMANLAGHKGPAGNASGERNAALERLLSADFETATDAIRGYLVAATAKDCSLMITLAPCLPRSAPSGDSRHDSSDAAGASPAAAELGTSEVNCCAETISREEALRPLQDPCLWASSGPAPMSMQWEALWGPVQQRRSGCQENGCHHSRRTRVWGRWCRMFRQAHGSGTRLPLWIWI